MHTLFLKWNHYASITCKIFTAHTYYINLEYMVLLEPRITKVNLHTALHRNTTGCTSPSYRSHQNSDWDSEDHRVQAHGSPTAYSSSCCMQYFSRLAPFSWTAQLSSGWQNSAWREAAHHTCKRYSWKPWLHHLIQLFQIAKYIVPSLSMALQATQTAAHT